MAKARTVAKSVHVKTIEDFREEPDLDEFQRVVDILKQEDDQLIYEVDNYQ